RIDQREQPVGVCDGKRKAGETRPRADIGNARPAQMRVYREAVEQMVRDQRLAAADRGEVVGGIPALQFIEQSCETLRLRIAERHIEQAGPLDERSALQMPRGPLAQAPPFATSAAMSS